MNDNDDPLVCNVLGKRKERRTSARRVGARRYCNFNQRLDRGAFRLVSKGRLLFLVPVSPHVHFEGVENRNFFFWTGDFVNSTFLSGRFCEQHGCTGRG